MDGPTGRDTNTMSTLGKTIAIKGELRCHEDLTVEGRIDGPVWCEDGAVGPAATATRSPGTCTP
jgi:hypothetical protein